MSYTRQHAELRALFLFLQSKIVPWWPNGVGDPTLYTLHVTFIPDTTGEKAEKSLRIGFRTVKLVQNVLPQNAGAYCFQMTLGRMEHVW